MDPAGKVVWGIFLAYRRPMGVAKTYQEVGFNIWRWHRSGEAFPCFRTSQDWYRIKLMKRDNQHLQSLLNNHTASQWTKKLYNLAGLQMSRVSHAPRQSGARLAELNGVSESQVSSTLSTNLPFLLFYSSSLQIRRGGRWNND